MTPNAERQDLATYLLAAANLIRLPATPSTWPAWMTQEKRISMAMQLENWAAWALVTDGQQP